MTFNQDQLQEQILQEIAAAAYAYVYDKIPSRTLRQALQILINGPDSASLFIAHYWALYVHDGRQPFEGVFMCWFRNPQQDPRLIGGETPPRKSMLRHLTSEEFRYWMQQNRIAERAVYGRLRRPGEAQVGPMLVTTRITKATPPQQFFANTAGGGMDGFAATLDALVQPIISRYVPDIMGDDLNVTITMDFPLNF